MIKLCDTHQVVYDSVKWVWCPVCEDYREIDRHERENERLRMALETALKHMPSVILATPKLTPAKPTASTYGITPTEANVF